MKTKIWLFALLPLIFGILANSQPQSKAEFEFKGIVLDSDNGEPLIGAQILVKGTKVGAVTDFDGRFHFDYSKRQATLVVEYTGYASQEIEAEAGKETSIRLSGGVQLSEMVVVAKGEARRKARRRNRKARVATEGEEMSVAYSVPTQAFPSPPATIAPNVRQQPSPANTEDYDHINENRFFEVAQQPLSTFSIDVDAASYSNMRRFVNDGQIPPADAIRIEEMVNYFNYSYPQPTGEHPFEVITEIGPCPWKPENRLFHIGMQAKKIEMNNLPASNLVFLIDVSGSMRSANKLPLLKSSFKLLADQMRPNDRVAIVVYAGAAGLVLPSTAGTNTRAIKEAIEKLSAGGSTAGGAGIKLAYKVARDHFIQDGNNRVILATDGDFNVGESSDAAMVRLIEKERQSGVFLTVLGFGMGNYKDNKMQKLANTGNGNHAYIDNIKEAKKVLINEFGGTMFTVAKDVKLQLEFNPAKVKGYRLIGYENRVLNNEDFNDDQKDAGEMGAGHTVTALYEIIPAGVESEYLAKVDPLKYQNLVGVASASDELLTVKLRYKRPDGHKSRLIEKPVADYSHSSLSENFNWSATVAQFGMLLRRSKYKGSANYADAIRLGERSKGKDPNGYRAEMIELMKKVQSRVAPELAGK